MDLECIVNASQLGHHVEACRQPQAEESPSRSWSSQLPNPNTSSERVRAGKGKLQMERTLHTRPRSDSVADSPQIPATVPTGLTTTQTHKMAWPCWQRHVSLLQASPASTGNRVPRRQLWVTSVIDVESRKQHCCSVQSPNCPDAAKEDPSPSLVAKRFPQSFCTHASARCRTEGLGHCRGLQRTRRAPRTLQRNPRRLLQACGVHPQRKGRLGGASRLGATQGCVICCRLVD